jgi:hypothetical protein
VTVRDQLLREGLESAEAIGNPTARARHRVAWAYRAALAAPEIAVALAGEPDFPEPGELLVTVAADRARAGEPVEPYFSQALAWAEGAEPDARLRTLNGLSEIAIEVAETDRSAGGSLLRSLLPLLESLRPTGEPAEPSGCPDCGPSPGQHHTLGCALLGEALWMLDDPRGRDLLAEAEAGAANLAAAEPILGFLIGALASRDPGHALTLLSHLSEGPGRTDAALALFGSLPEGPDRDAVYEIAVQGARQIAHWQGPEHLVSLAQAVAGVDARRGRALFEEALEEARKHPPQMQALQLTGIASAAAPHDRGWAEALFQEALAAAAREEEPVKRATTLTLIANELAEPLPRQAAEVFAGAMAEAEALEAVWELAHLMDVVFRPDRSPFLDVSPAQPLLERMVDLISDEDPRIPGVLGVADVGRAMREINPERALELYWRWFRAAEAAADPDGMGSAALTLHAVDPTAGLEAFVRTQEFLIARKDCPAMGDFSRRAGPLAPELVLELAPHIPDRRERADALVEAAVGLFAQAPEQALEAVRGFPNPADRSLALLRMFDTETGVNDRPLPDPLLEDLP